MTKLIDIKCNCNTSYNSDLDDIWEAKILLEDDGWFEGIAIDSNDIYTGNRFVFGVYYPGKFIELFKLAPVNISNPLLFHGKRGSKGYNGDVEILGAFGTLQCGNANITTQDAEKVRENVEAEIQKLRLKIDQYKTDVMDANDKSFYDSYVSARDGLYEISSSYYENKKLTDDEFLKLIRLALATVERSNTSTDEQDSRLINAMKTGSPKKPKNALDLK